MKDILRADMLAGVLTWFVVSAVSLYLMYGHSKVSITGLVVAAILFVAYIILWLFSILDGRFAVNRKLGLAVIALLFSIVITLYFLSPYQFTSILLGIVCSMLAYYFPNRIGLALVCLASLPLYFVYAFYWEYSGALISSILFWTFNIFAYVMVNAVKKEQEAKEEAINANLRLVSTQALLEQAVMQGERVRIARNIHDLLGHHLTALSIHLQVASRQSQGEVKENIEKCHQLSKLLLSDVREAVSDIRNKSNIDIRSTIEKMQKELPEIDISLLMEESVNIDDIEIADTLIKCIQESVTNTLRHARGKMIKILLTQDKDSLSLHIENDGRMPESVNIGNGLKGIQERIEAFKGLVEFSIKDRRFLTSVSIPQVQYD